MSEYWGKIIKCKDKTCKGCFYSNHQFVNCDMNKLPAKQFDEVIIGTNHLMKIKPSKLNK